MQEVKVIFHSYDPAKDVEAFNNIIDNGYEIKTIDNREGYSIVICEKIHKCNF